VFVLITGVVKVVTPEPFGRGVPPVGSAYQSIVSAGPTVAEIFTDPVPHLDPPTAIGGAGPGVGALIVTVTVPDIHFDPGSSFIATL
jgi:hypothetical protein